MFDSCLRERFPGVGVAEAHSKVLAKALAKALGGWDSTGLAKLGRITAMLEHERDATLAAMAAREGFVGRWPRDLSIDRYPSEHDPKAYWLAPVSYFWPQ